MATRPMTGSNPSQPNPQDVNMAARNAVLARSIDMMQPIFQTTLAGTIPGQVLNIPLRNVGLIKKLLVKISFDITPVAAETHTLTPFGLANVLSNVTFTDLSNQQRVNTTGWHLHFLSCLRRQQVYGAAYTTDSPAPGTVIAPWGIGSNFNVIYSPPVVAGAVAHCTMYYEVPIAYSDFDLRGAIYGSVVSATMNLQLTINQNFEVTSAATDITDAVYQSSSGVLGTLSNFDVQVYQNYLDQLPIGKNGVVLPILDLSTAYLLNNTNTTGMVVNQDFPVPYANFRNFMSTIAVFNNAGALGVGADVAFWALQSANYTNIFRLDPVTVAHLNRNIQGVDMPAGVYTFDHRRRPISTVQYGNMSLVLNPSVVAAGANLMIGYEALGMINMVTQAGSLYGN
jgi:hypothetical protein